MFTIINCWIFIFQIKSGQTQLATDGKIHNLNLIEANKISTLEAFNALNAAAVLNAAMTSHQQTATAPVNSMIEDTELAHTMFSKSFMEKSLMPANLLHHLTANTTHSSLYPNQMQFMAPSTIAAAAAAAYYNSNPHFSQIKPPLSPSGSSQSPSAYQRNYLEALRFYKAAYESKWNRLSFERIYVWKCKCSKTVIFVLKCKVYIYTQIWSIRND